MASFSYSSAFNLSENPPSFSASFSSSSGGMDHDDLDDACSICLEPFTVSDPSTVTSCKHEYHLQCILEWSQRSKECPICLQLFVLKDPTSQELLAAVARERCLRSRNTDPALPRTIYHRHEDFTTNEDASHADDSDEHIMQRLATAASRACLVHRRERLRSSGLGPSQAPVVIPPANMLNANQIFDASMEEHQFTNDHLSNGMSSAILSHVSSEPPSVICNDSSINGDGDLKFRAFSGPSLNSSEMFSLPESIKSKLSSVSARYKESIFKSSRSLKEKLLAHNDSMKELSKGVQREMSAGISGVARMIERLDLASRRPGGAMPGSASNGGTSTFSFKGKHVEENSPGQTPPNTNLENKYNLSSEAPSFSITFPDRAEVPHAQGGHRC